ncbi:hypothetical protein ACQPZ8_34295 [Actinomadura nitritigenes]|uniref:hypothetical protein n=1 Tax=Actinomadura nitritigenes TaxID=134602 RepID=UPI003497984A
MSTPMYTTDRIPDDQEGVTTLGIRAGQPASSPESAFTNLERASADLRPDAVMGVCLLAVPNVVGRTDFTTTDVMRIHTETQYIAYGTCVRFET